MSFTGFLDKRVIVMGLGRFGGGVGAARWLAEQGARVLVSDLATEARLADSVRKLEGLPIEFHLGGHHVADLDGADLLVVNPAVDKSKSDFVKAAIARNIALSSEMNLFFERCPAKIIGVTGTVGKSTTTAMIFDVLYAELKHLKGSPNNVWLGGNIGDSLLPDLHRIAPQDYVVLELSSFQLEDLAPLHTSPHIAVLTNLTPHHLERHGDFESYIRAKAGLFAYQTPGDFAVVSEQAAAVLRDHVPIPDGIRIITYGPAMQLAGQLRVIGEHNLHNAAAATEVGRLLSLSDEVIFEELREFSGLPHRLEFVREYNGVSYYNDSKATSPEATITALKAFDKKVILLCGGYDKHVPFDALAEAICERTRLVICFGETRAKIATYIRRLECQRPLPALKTVHEFNGGPNLARRLAQPGDVVLFSPACASFDEFANFEQRGDRFKTIVMGWI